MRKAGPKLNQSFFDTPMSHLSGTNALALLAVETVSEDSATENILHRCAIHFSLPGWARTAQQTLS